MQACPHCAYTNLQSMFKNAYSSLDTIGAALPVRKEARRFAPIQPVTGPLAQIAQPVSPVHVAAATPPIQTQHHTTGLKLRSQVEEAAQTVASSVIPSTVPALAGGGLSEGGPRMMPSDVKFVPFSTEDGIVVSEAYTKQYARSYTWLWLTAGLLIAVGSALLIFKPTLIEGLLRGKHQVSGTPVNPKPSSNLGDSLPNPYPPRPECMVDLLTSEKLCHTLLTKLVNATNSQERLQCIARPQEKQQSLIEFFAIPENKMSIENFRLLPAQIKLLPGRHESYVFEARTNGLKQGTTLVRLTGEDRHNLHLDWDLLHDSHTLALTRFAKKPEGSSQWISIGFKRRSGLDAPVQVREKYHVFDIQGQGDGLDRMVVYCPKDSQFGRAVDKAFSWAELYLIRALLNWSNIEGEPRIIVLDAMNMPGAE